MDIRVKDPLIEALPPATDYMTYLTILEYNLTGENIHTLEKLLHDAELTINIGWDLVHLLLPFLPSSQASLMTIARLGNPREVVLKVTECLRALEIHDVDNDSVEGDEELGQNSASTKRNDVIAGSGNPESPNQRIQVLQFNVLLSMLSVLHLRIKTKTPSRFLATSLEAVVATLTRAETSVDVLTATTLRFLEHFMNQQGPDLPERPKEPLQNRTISVKQMSAMADAEVETRLIQAFLTHVVEVYTRSLNASEDVPGLAWASRVYEKLHPARVIPGRSTFNHKFETESTFRDRDDIVKRVEALSQLYGLDSIELVRSVLQAEQPVLSEVDVEDDLPDSADDIPLSASGSLLLLGAQTATAVLRNDGKVLSTFGIFPEHAQIVSNFLGANAKNTLHVGPAESEALVDALLVLGLHAVEKNRIGQPDDDETFSQYLQLLSMLSADSQSPSLRFQAHSLVTTVLHSHPDDNVRLYFIRDTLEHCPYENLKVSAVGWLKDETLRAFSGESGSASSRALMFATPIPLNATAMFLFPDVTSLSISSNDLELWTGFKANLSFYLSVLNFYYMLLSAPEIGYCVEIAKLHTTHHVEHRFLQPLQESCRVFGEVAQDSFLAQVEGPEGIRMAQMDVMLLEDVLSRVKHACRLFQAV